MKIHDGVACNCSEAVVRLKKADYERFRKECLDKEIEAALDNNQVPWGLLRVGSKESGGYSDMVPTSEDEICLYFIQSNGRWLISKLDEFKIPHDTDQWTSGWEVWRDDYTKINMDGSIPLVKDIEGVHVDDDEYWSYWRRKPYT